MKNIVFLLGCASVLSGCATLSSISQIDKGADEYLYQFDSTPSGSKIVVNGKDEGTTPTELTLMAKKRWVGILVEPGGWKYENNRYYVEITSPDNRLKESVYINPKNPEGGRSINLALTPYSESNGVDKGKVLGIKEPFLPTLKSAGYVRIVEINGKSAREWGGNDDEVELLTGSYHLGAICKWDLGINGEISFENFWPIKLQVEANKTYQLKTEIIENHRCSVSWSET